MGLQLYNLFSKPLTSAEKSLLQKGPIFTMTPSFTPIIEYITATKCICDSLEENNLFRKTDCNKYYAKVKDVLTKFKNNPKPLVPNITKEERKALFNVKKDDSHMVLTADKGADLVVMDKDMYIEKGMPY